MKRAMHLAHIISAAERWGFKSVERISANHFCYTCRPCSIRMRQDALWLFLKFLHFTIDTFSAASHAANFHSYYSFPCCQYRMYTKASFASDALNSSTVAFFTTNALQHSSLGSHIWTEFWSCKWSSSPILTWVQLFSCHIHQLGSNYCDCNIVRYK